MIADLADIERLASLAGNVDRQTWWAPWTDVVLDWLCTFVGLEGLASHVAQYATAVFPALLQTEDYSPAPQPAMAASGQTTTCAP